MYRQEESLPLDLDGPGAMWRDATKMQGPSSLMQHVHACNINIPEGRGCTSCNMGSVNWSLGCWGYLGNVKKGPSCSKNRRQCPFNCEWSSFTTCVRWRIYKIEHVGHKIGIFKLIWHFSNKKVNFWAGKNRRRQLRGTTP